MNVYALSNPRALHNSMRLFLTLSALSDTSGEFQINKEQLAKYLHTTPQTIGAYLISFVHAGMLKYKYSGKGMFNPEFTTNNTKSNKVKYNNFKSDII